MLTVRPSLSDDVDHLSVNLRSADLEEIAAHGEHDAHSALMAGLGSPDGCFTVISEQTPVAMFGTYPSDVEGVGFVWLLASPDIIRDKVQFLREARPWVLAFHDRYPVMTNVVHCRNLLHLRWLRWMGFQITRPMNINEHSFFQFVRSRHV